jgi:thioredoxin reductase
MAGLAAAIEAARRGVAVTLIDAGETPGGQTLLQPHIYDGTNLRGYELGPTRWREAEGLGVTSLPRTVAWGLFEDRMLGLAIDHGTAQERGQLLQADAVLVATGAVDRVSSFPGSTLPGVMTMTAAMTALHRWRIRPGTRALIVGDDPTGPYIAGYARDGGMRVDTLPRSTDLRAQAGADGTLARLVADGTAYDVDTVILAEGMQPANELARMVDCETVCCESLGGWVPLRDATMRTSVPWLFVAGDAAGVADAGIAVVQGRAAAANIAALLGKQSQPSAPFPIAIAPNAFRPLDESVWDEVRLMETAR